MTLVLGNLGSTQVKASRNKTPALLQQSIKEKKKKTGALLDSFITL
jgi:hypothetical protein